MEVLQNRMKDIYWNQLKFSLLRFLLNEVLHLIKLSAEP